MTRHKMAAVATVRGQGTLKVDHGTGFEVAQIRHRLRLLQEVKIEKGVLGPDDGQAASVDRHAIAKLRAFSQRPRVDCQSHTCLLGLKSRRPTRTLYKSRKHEFKQSR